MTKKAFSLLRQMNVSLHTLFFHGGFSRKKKEIATPKERMSSYSALLYKIRAMRAAVSTAKERMSSYSALLYKIRAMRATVSTAKQRINIVAITTHATLHNSMCKTYGYVLQIHFSRGSECSAAADAGPLATTAAAVLQQSTG